MYCSHCGSSTADDLNYCKNCGFRTSESWGEDTSRIKRLALIAAAAIGTVGLVGFFSVLRELLQEARSLQTAMVILLIAYLAALLLMFTVLVRHAFKNGEDRDHAARERAPEQPAYFRAVNTAQLPDMPASVTEHTTRTPRRGTVSENASPLRARPLVSITSGNVATPSSGTTPTQNSTLMALSSEFAPLAAMLPTRNGPIAAISLPIL